MESNKIEGLANPPRPQSHGQMYRNLHGEAIARVKMLPSKYFRRQCFIAVEPTEPYLGQLVDRSGADNLIFGSDYPHVVAHYFANSTPKVLTSRTSFEEY